MNAAWSFSESLGGGVIRVATGTPTSKKNFSCPAGAQIQSVRTASTEALWNWWGALNVQGFAGADGRILATEGGFHLAFEDDKGLLEVMPVPWRTAAGRDVHVDDAEASGSLLAGHGNGVGIADQPDVRQVFELSKSEAAFGIVRRNCPAERMTFCSPQGLVLSHWRDSLLAKRSGLRGKILVTARSVPQEFRQLLDISRLSDETTFEIPLKPPAACLKSLSTVRQLSHDSR
jgi:hypothetical protein